MANVHWEMGQVLLPEHFKMQQEHAHLLSAQISTNIQGYQDGVIDFSIDQSSFSCGTLKVETLSLFLADMTYLLNGFNAKCQSFELDPNQIKDSKLNIYINIKNEVIIEQERINYNDIDVVFYDLFFDTKFNPEAHYSIKLLELKYDEVQLNWEILSYKPKLLRLPKLYAQGYLDSFKANLAILDQILKAKTTNKYVSYKYQALFLKISELDFWLQCQNTLSKTICINELLQNLHSLYQSISMLLNNITHSYQPSSNNLQNCDALIKLIEDELNVDKNDQPLCYQLNLNNGIYQTDILDEQFFVAEKRFLIVETNQGEPTDEVVLIKAFSPSRARDILLRSLPGVELPNVEKQEVEKFFPNAQFVMEITASGAEWDAVVNERVLCIKSTMAANESCQIYVACA